VVGGGTGHYWCQVLRNRRGRRGDRGEGLVEVDGLGTRQVQVLRMVEVAMVRLTARGGVGMGTRVGCHGLDRR
jgi:hypothetical protein